MLHLKWEILRNKNLLSGLDKIRNSTRIGFEPAYRAGRVTESIASEQTKANDKNIELLKKYAKKDERGHFVPVSNSDGELEFSEGNREKYEEELKPLADTAFVIKAKQIEHTSIKDCGLTPSEIIALVDSGIMTEPV